MPYFFQNIRILSLFVLLSLITTGSVFSGENIKLYESDSVEIMSLCDSSVKYFTNLETSLKFASKSNKIAIGSSCESCIAEAEFTLGLVFYKNSLYDSALIYFDLALTKFSKGNYSNRVLETIEYISDTYISTYDYNESINYAKKGLAFADSLGLTDIQANFYFLLGTSYQELGQYQMSVNSLISGLEIYESEKDSNGISGSLINLGLVFSNNNNFHDAFEYVSRALEICTIRDDSYGISICLNNIGNVYSSTGEYEKALDYFQSSLEVVKKAEDQEGIAIALSNIGDCYLNLGDTILGVSYYTKSLKVGRPINSRIVSTVLLDLGKIYMSKGNDKLALRYAKESLEVAETTSVVSHLLNSYSFLQSIYSDHGNYKVAYDYLVKHRNLYDSTYTIKKSKQILEIKAKYDNERQKLEIADLRKSHTHESTTRIFLQITIIVISLLIIAMVIFNILIRRSRRLVRDEKSYYEKLLERSEDFVFVVTKNGITKYISPSYERKIGREIKNRIGKSTFEFIHPDDIDEVKQEFNKLIVNKQSRSIEFRMKNAFDSWINLYAYGQNLLDDKHINGIVINFWDITQRKKNEEIIRKNELKFRQIFNAFPDIYFQSDMNGVITEVSPSIEKITGYTQNEIIGISPKEYYLILKDWKRIGTIFQTELSINDFDTKVITKNGKVIHCSLSAALIYTDDSNIPTGIKGVIHDISNRVKNQQKLRKSELELKDANRSKEKLFSIIAHDLIGPIGTNKSIVDLIVSQVDELSQDEIINLISSLKPSLDSTYSLIENLLSWARIQQDRLKPNPESISLNHLVNDMVTLLHSQAQRKSITLSVTGDEPITVRADKNQLDIVLRNLVSNAIKFSNPGGNIIISLERGDGVSEINITDSGIGMTKSQINKILKGKESVEVRRGTDNEKGTGFGLLIVVEFIRSNNGTLTISSKEGEGTTFTVTLPLSS